MPAAAARQNSAVASSAGNVHSIRNSSIVTSRGVPNLVIVEKNRRKRGRCGALK